MPTGAWGSCSRVAAVTVSVSPLLRGQILHEGVELLLRQRLERLRHHVVRVALLDVGARIHDRLARELGQRLPRALGLLRQLVEIRPDLPGRAGGLERVTGRAAVVLEYRGAQLRPAARRRRLRLAAQPSPE